MKTKTASIACAMLLVLAVAGCTARLGSFTLLSTKNIDFSRMAEYTRYNERVTGKDSRTVILLIIPTKFEITIQEAVDRAIEKIPGGVALADVVVRIRVVMIPPFITNQAYIVKGTVIVDPKLIKATATTTESKFALIHANDKNEFVRKDLTDEEYEKIQSRIYENSNPLATELTDKDGSAL